MRLFFLRCKMMWENSLSATVLLICIFAAGFFCLNLLVGFGETDYGYAISDSQKNTIAITDINHKLEKLDLYSYFTEKTDYRICEILYLSEYDPYHMLIGWSGTNNCALWFPHVSGRFFSQEEIMGNEEGLIYLSNNLLSEVNEKKQYVVEDFEYSVIGTGWIITQNLTVAELPVKIFSHVRPHEDPAVEILPYHAFLKRNHPAEVIYVYVTGYTTRERIKMTKEIQEMFPGTVVTTSDFESEHFRMKRLSEMSLVGIVFSLLIWASLSSAFSLWLERNKKVYSTLRVCGMSLVNTCTQTFFLLVALVFMGQGVALLLQALLSPALSFLRIENYPPILYLLVSPCILLFCVYAVNIRSILRVAKRNRVSE